MFEKEIAPERNPLQTHSPVANLATRPLGFIGVLLAFVAALALLTLPRFEPVYSGPSGPVELRAGQPAQK